MAGETVAPRTHTRGQATRHPGQTTGHAGAGADVPAANQIARAVDIDAGHALVLPGILTIPPQPVGLVVFAQASASSRLRPPDRAVARALNMAGIATLLFDLLTLPEEADERNVFEIPLLAPRLVASTTWLQRHDATRDLALGYLGSSTGAAAALTAAATLRHAISAIVLRGGRTDLAQSSLPEVEAPTLLVVGGSDWEVLEHNRRARSLLRCKTDLVVIPGATHFFEEAGARNQVTDLTIAWFQRHLRSPGSPRTSQLAQRAGLSTRERPAEDRRPRGQKLPARSSMAVDTAKGRLLDPLARESPDDLPSSR